MSRLRGLASLPRCRAVAGATLHLDDVSGIPFLVDVDGVEQYQHRARLRAGDGDLFATVTPAVIGYEDYCRGTLGLGKPTHLVAETVAAPIEVSRACAHGEAYAQLKAFTCSVGGLVIHPYMGIEACWDLASKLERDTACSIHVIAPPPPVTWLANDKAAFLALVRDVLGEKWTVPTCVARDVEQIAKHLRTLAEKHRRVGLKRTRCASAMGNHVFSSAELLQNPAVIEARVQEFLRRTQWPPGEEVLAVAWLETDLSPSTQTWIPPVGQGAPALDGIYEQILEGEKGLFVGSRPSTLPDRVNQELGESALKMAAALQERGYVGRCSFDHLVVGDPHGEFTSVFSECNGRWGGTSTPMSLLDRILGGPRPPYRAQDVVFEGLKGTDFNDLVKPLQNLLFDPRSGRGRFILYNVGPLQRFGKFDVISLGRTQEEAEEGVVDVLPRALGFA